jgi:hypothetical protein
MKQPGEARSSGTKARLPTFSSMISAAAVPRGLAAAEDDFPFRAVRR